MQHQEQMHAPVAQYVGIGSRFLAILIDSIILGVIAGLLVANFGTQQPVASGGTTGVIGLIYFIVMEATRGATLGKMALGLHVVRVDGGPIGWKESLIRNLLRIIDSLFLYLVAALSIRFSPLKQRLGDKAAHTVVVRSR